MDKYIVVARERSPVDPRVAYQNVGEITGYPENEAVVEAYAMVRDDKAPNVAEYWLVRDENPQAYDRRITIHKGAEPICDTCWRKNLKKLEPLKHYRSQPDTLQRCSRCGKGTTDAWFTWLR